MFNLKNEETPVRRLFVPCYLIEHSDGRLLWDGGLPIESAGKNPTEQAGMRMSYEVSLVDQLAAMDLDPADIELVAFSHMHFDHVGAANLFANSKLLIQEPEYQAAFIDKNNEFFQPDLYMGLAESKRLVLEGDHDVFGDGSVVIVSAPGHTPGHQVLLLRLENFGPLILSGDLYHFRKNRELRRVPLFNSDAQQTLESMEKVEALIAAEGATLWIEHDQALADTLNKTPRFYD
jgi:glyoxylase-like metal-dependent hydrolase (beta-lactamase superfamily II)